MYPNRMGKLPCNAKKNRYKDIVPCEWLSEQSTFLSLFGLRCKIHKEKDENSFVLPNCAMLEKQPNQV